MQALAGTLHRLAYWRGREGLGWPRGRPVRSGRLSPETSRASRCGARPKRYSRRAALAAVAALCLGAANGASGAGGQLREAVGVAGSIRQSGSYRVRVVHQDDRIPPRSDPGRCRRRWKRSAPSMGSPWIGPRSRPSSPMRNLACVSGDRVPADDRRRAHAPQQAEIERYIRAGGGYVGVHSACDTEYDWPWYGQLVGAYFNHHPEIQTATVRSKIAAHPSTAGLPERWERTDEWYDFRTSPRGQVQVLLRLDEATYRGGGMGADHPIAWYHDVDGGRAWYTAGGHTAESYREPLFSSICWAASSTLAGTGHQQIRASGRYGMSETP